jgi:hypothetical protein
MTTVFVASSWRHSSRVRQMHRALEPHGIECLSEWATGAAHKPAEDLDAMSDTEALEAWEANHYAVSVADVALFIVDCDPDPREGFKEAARRQIVAPERPAIWIGPPTLTVRCAWKVWPGLRRVANDAEAVAEVVRIAARQSRTHAAE